MCALSSLKPWRLTRIKGISNGADTRTVSLPIPNTPSRLLTDSLASAAGILRNWTQSGITTRSEARKVRFTESVLATHSFTRAPVQIHGIGDSIAEKIEEIARTGTYRRLSMRTAEQNTVAAFAQIYGVASKKGQILYDEGARSIDDLRDDPERFRLTAAQKLGVQYYEDLLQRIPRNEVSEIFSVGESWNGNCGGGGGLLIDRHHSSAVEVGASGKFRATVAT